MSRLDRDTKLLWILSASALLASAVLVLILMFLAAESWPALSRNGIAAFFAGKGWHPTEGAFDVTPMLVASLATSMLAMALAVPLGVRRQVFWDS